MRGPAAKILRELRRSRLADGEILPGVCAPDWIGRGRTRLRALHFPRALHLEAPFAKKVPAANSHSKASAASSPCCSATWWLHELANRVDPEVLQGFIRSYEDACAVCITRYEGYVFQRLVRWHRGILRLSPGA
jgi:hypothetical protein